MREIKFKAWDRKAEFYGECVGILWIDKTVDIQGFHKDFDKQVLRIGQLDDCDLLEYTGLKDKNGKEIYEGDILKTSTPYGVVNHLVDNLSDVGYEIREGYGSFELREIIGNIYENPELLENDLNGR